MIAKIANIAVWLLIAVSIVVFGWDEPLRYHFISEEQVKSEERSALPPPTPRPDYRTWPSSSTLSSGKLGESPINGHGMKGTPKHGR